MKLGSRRFERAARRRVRREVSASPELKKERRRLGSRNRNWNSVPTWIGYVFLGSLVFRGATRGDPGLILIALTLFSVGWAFFRGAGAMRDFYSGPEIGALVHYPMSDADFFTMMWRKSLWTFALPSVAIFGMAYLALALRSENLGPRVCAIAGACAALQAGSVIAGGLLLWRHYARWWRAWWLAWAIPIAGIVLYGLAGGAPGSIPPPSGPVEALLPVGWPAAAFRFLELESSGWGFGVGLLAVAFVLTIPWTLSGLKKSYQVNEILLAGAGTADAQVEEAVDRVAADLAGPAPATKSDRSDARSDFEGLAEDRIRSRAFLSTAHDRSGAIETVCGWLLTPRERIVAGFLHGGRPGWSRSWAWSALLSAAAVGVTVAIPGRQEAPIFLIAFALITIAWGIGFPGFGWPGFRLTAAGPVGQPYFAAYPVAFGESVSVLLKSHVVRCLAMAPVSVAITAVGAHELGIDAGRGAGFGLNLVLLLLALGPLVVVFRYADISRDASFFFWQGALMFILAVPACLAAPVAVVLVVVCPSVEAVAITLGGTALLSGATLALFGSIVRKGRRDFIRPLARNSL